MRRRKRRGVNRLIMRVNTRNIYTPKYWLSPPSQRIIIIINIVVMMRLGWMHLKDPINQPFFLTELYACESVFLTHTHTHTDRIAEDCVCLDHWLNYPE